jgi:tRNA(Ile)-lysidine synthase
MPSICATGAMRNRPEPGADHPAVIRVTAELDAALAAVDPERIRLAVSGGRDSMLLLERAVRRARLAATEPPRVLHVHHGLMTEADAWAERVRRRCAELDCPCEVRRVEVRPEGRGIEAAAREARLACFGAWLDPGARLLVAQHAGDQAETVLLRLLRGAGPRGLAGMPALRRLGAGWLQRPWLDLEVATIDAAARALELDWVEDPSNADRGLDRAFLRHEILPRLRQRWPGLEGAFGRSAAAAADQEGLLDELLPAVPADGAPLSCALLRGDPRRAHALLRRWLDAAGQTMAPRTRLDELLRQLDAPADAGVRVDLEGGASDGVGIRRHGDRLHLVPSSRPSPRPEVALRLPGTTGLGSGCLRIEAAVGSGLRADRGTPRVGFRQGGERLRPPGRGGSVRLKQWLQEQGIPPWERDRLPLLWLGDELVAVADRVIAEGWQAPSDTAGWRLEWMPAEIGGGGSR